MLLTDGEDTQTSYSYDTYIDYAVENDITTYTIGLGDSIDTTLLRKIANTTGGIENEASNIARCTSVEL